MSLIYRAELSPTKNELLQAWAPGQPWFAGDADAAFASVAAYRFDDPAGEVGIEALLVRAGAGEVLHIPVTYRGEPLAGADTHLIGTTEHSVLGTRWVYDAIGDPVYLAALAAAIFTGGREADLYVDVDGERVFRESTALVRGSGSAGDPVPALGDSGEIAVLHSKKVTGVSLGDLEVLLVRVIGGDGSAVDVDEMAAAADDPAVLTGTWAGQAQPLTLAYAWDTAAG
jgi:hypothetical protein